MFIKYNRNIVDSKYLSLKKEDTSYPDFEIKHKYSSLLPLKNNSEIHTILKNKNIHIVTVIYNYKISLDFFFRLIQTIAKDDICYVFNEYHYLDEMKKNLTKKYIGRLIVNESNPYFGFLEFNTSLVDPESIFDWYDLWGHGFNGWIFTKENLNHFEEIISNKATNEGIINFLTSRFIKVEFGDVHESIRFISLTDEIAKEIERLLQIGS